ncbi:PDDEXK nuclease domain-containing protein [Microbacterium profundi]|nr:PDDEXK nuclease domain-containing protein [Microbacterium profundi]
MGHVLAERTDDARWGSKVIQRLSADLRAEFPDSRGFSPRNLIYMRSFARAWPGLTEIAQQAVAQLPWGHITVLLDKLSDQELRDWYAGQTATHGWTRGTLEHHIKTTAHLRFGEAPTNFDRILAPGASELAQQMTKDPYVFDFLRIEPGHAERELEQALVERIIETLGELGSGFSFVGRQVPFDVDGDEFFVDLLFFHVEQLRYVVVELKVGKFKPEYAGQLGFYVELVEDHLRRPAHASTVGLLLCTDKNDRVVRYALAGSNQPIAIASYDLLPPAEQAVLPSEAELQRALDDR